MSVYRRNLIIMVVLWSFGVFSFYMIPYYIGTLDLNVYAMNVATALGEVVAAVLCLFITNTVDKRKSTSVSTGISFLGCVGVTLILWLYHGNDQIFPAASFLILYTGLVTMFNIIYVIVPELFPTIYLATSYGCINVIGRFVAMTCPLVARAPFPWPMLILAGYSLICTFIPWGLILIKGNQV